MGVPSFAIGSDLWPGLSKLAEECGELLQVIGKLQAYPEGEHPDGAGDLATRLIEEMGDVLAAIAYTREHNELNGLKLYTRRDLKLQRFKVWHDAERNGGNVRLYRWHCNTCGSAGLWQDTESVAVQGLDRHIHAKPRHRITIQQKESDAQQP